MCFRFELVRAICICSSADGQVAHRELKRKWPTIPWTPRTGSGSVGLRFGEYRHVRHASKGFPLFPGFPSWGRSLCLLGASSSLALPGSASSDGEYNTSIVVLALVAYSLGWVAVWSHIRTPNRIPNGLGVCVRGRNCEDDTRLAKNPA
ncbi:hypothetical protein LX36DRAFT_440040 [Colletotrichum falcatum]|nr:hypothetical protein LX36DRAFT_440040 [Colletotrichum falcatum]